MGNNTSYIRCQQGLHQSASTHFSPQLETLPKYAGIRARQYGITQQIILNTCFTLLPLWRVRREAKTRERDKRRLLTHLRTSLRRWRLHNTTTNGWLGSKTSLIKSWCSRVIAPNNSKYWRKRESSKMIPHERVSFFFNCFSCTTTRHSADETLHYCSFPYLLLLRGFSCLLLPFIFLIPLV